MCRFGGTILPTRFIEKTYWAMAGMLFKKEGERRFPKGELNFPQPLIIPVFRDLFRDLGP